MPNPINQTQNQQFAQAMQQYQADRNATRVEFVGGTAYSAPRTPASAAPAAQETAKAGDTREFQRITKGTPNRNCSPGPFKKGETS